MKRCRWSAGREPRAELQERKAAITAELQTLQTEDYYTVALEQNLALLESFRAKLGEGFEELPFGVRRQVVLNFVEGIEVHDRREVRVNLKVRLDNQGVEHLCDEISSAEKGTSDGQNEKSAGLNQADALFVPSGTKWLPLVDGLRRLGEDHDFRVRAKLIGQCPVYKRYVGG